MTATGTHGAFLSGTAARHARDRLAKILRGWCRSVGDHQDDPMPWDNTPEARRRSAETYGDPEYQANRTLALQRADGRCEQCGRTSRPLHVDHKTNRANGGSHHHTNLQVLCSGPGSCHAKKTARESNYGTRAADPEPAVRTKW